MINSDQQSISKNYSIPANTAEHLQSQTIHFGR